MPEPLAAIDISTTRLEAFSDGVIAIIVTIMVLDLKPPGEATAAALLAEWPTFLSYALSFLVVAIYWVNHRHVVRYVTHVSHRLLWANLLLLFTISLIPISTAWVGDHLTALAPDVAYGVVLTAAGLSFQVLSEVVYRQNAGRPEYEAAIRAERRKGMISLAINIAATVLALFVPYAVLAGAATGAALYFAPTYTPPAASA